MDKDSSRQARGFLTLDEVIATVSAANTVLDPHSLLVGSGVTIGKGNVFYPNVVIERSGEGVLSVGDDNVFYPGVYILSSAGAVHIADHNEFGTGGCTIKANMPDAEVRIGSNGRYCDGVSIMGKTTLGDGSQIIGDITVQSCIMGGGGSFQEPDPDQRGAVLKGFGLARDLQLQTGQVVNGSGAFADAPIEQQRAYHPHAPKTT
jgi:UDP-3-O-[3-hydroxymyristoyl] glucosamine N-acyltransferase